MYPGSWRIYPEKVKLRGEEYAAGFDKLRSLSVRGKLVEGIQIAFFFGGG